jgi:hypothetical protein
MGSIVKFIYGVIWATCCLLLWVSMTGICRPQWRRGLRPELPSPTQTKGSWVLITLEAWMFFFRICVVLLVGSDTITGWSPIQEVLLTVHKIKKLENPPPILGWRAILLWTRNRNFSTTFSKNYSSRILNKSVQWLRSWYNKRDRHHCHKYICACDARNALKVSLLISHRYDVCEMCAGWKCILWPYYLNNRY